MDFHFTDEQRLLRETLSRFCQDHYRFGVQGQTAPRPGYWSELAELGVLALPFQEADGGLGGDMVDAMLVMEVFGKALAPEPYLANIVLAGGVLKRLSDKDRRQALIGELVSGEARIALAHAEATNRDSLSHVDTTARREGNDFVLNGDKIAVLDGAHADTFIVSAMVKGAGLTLFLVPANSPGLSQQGYEGVDGFDTSNLGLANVRIGEEALLCEVGEGLDLLEPAIDDGIVAIGAEAIGIMSFLIEATIDYTKTRKQFDVPISSFQVLQHRMVDMFIEREATVSLLYKAAILAGSGGPEAAKAASALKVHLGRACRVVGQQAVQLHGGMGIADESPVAHYFKRLTIISQQFGAADTHARRYAAIDRRSGDTSKQIA
ncbi:acyl-CoA dehydrogenase family protein [Roseovarius amoyensis]|uniref:acyl-CoA dehydrogenase family protein n=1 Tax=Roseovarius amoyensis TaxID=2211448 RepID=UPI000DBEA6CA|nr:acyl-CoA dehydrogenase family protein [Roseovarius amoyensis]